MNERIKQIRKSLKLTQDDFAERLKISKNYICQLENGKKIPSDRLIASICYEFSINETWLLTGEGEMHDAMSHEAELAKISAQIFNEGDPVRVKLFEMLGQMSEKEMEALKTLKDFIERTYGGE